MNINIVHLPLCMWITNTQRSPVCNVDKESNERNWMDMIDDKESVELVQIG